MAVPMSMHSASPTAESFYHHRTSVLQGWHLPHVVVFAWRISNASQQGAQAFDEYVQLYGRDGKRRDLLQRMIAASTEKKIPAPLTDDEIVVELTNLIFAGTDTTGNTFSYMFWELARNPEWQTRLRDELRQVPGTSVVPEYQDISQLPVLDAIIQETLRLWPASPASLPRIASVNGGIIDGVPVPGNVSVSPESARHPLSECEPGLRRSSSRLWCLVKVSQRNGTLLFIRFPTNSAPNVG